MQKIKLKDLMNKLGPETEIEIDEGLLKPKPWPQEEDKYWFIDSDGEATEELHIAHAFDYARIAHHNTFRTEAHAKEAAQLVSPFFAQIQKSFEVDPEFKPDWDDDEQEKWTTSYDHDSSSFVVYLVWTSPHFGRPVSTQEKAQAMIDLLNADEKLMEVMRNG